MTRWKLYHSFPIQICFVLKPQVYIVLYITYWPHKLCIWCAECLVLIWEQDQYSFGTPKVHIVWEVNRIQTQKRYWSIFSQKLKAYGCKTWVTNCKHLLCIKIIHMYINECQVSANQVLTRPSCHLYTKSTVLAQEFFHLLAYKSYEVPRSVIITSGVQWSLSILLLGCELQFHFGVL